MPGHSPLNSWSRREFLASGSATAGMIWLGGGTALLPAAETAKSAPLPFQPVEIPAWVREVTRMSFLAPSLVPDVAKAGVEVVHGNAVWPYYPLRKEGGGLSERDQKELRTFVEATHQHGMRLVLGLPPFPSVAAMQAHPEWRTAPDRSGAELKIVPVDDNLGTRIPCNLGPWGDYLIELCAELLVDYKLDGYSFDGNYHPAICYCGACQSTYKTECDRDLPATVNLDDIAYREYLVWRGEKLEQHYLKLQQRLKSLNPDAVIMTWTTNAGRYGHFLHSPRPMPARMNLIIDLPMQEWWLDETNIGSSIVPTFGAEYLAAVTGYRCCGCEPYLMSRGNPYSGDSFPAHERMLRSLQVLAHGSTTAHSVGWTNGVAGAEPVFRETKRRAPWLTHARPRPWGAILVSEQTRQFYAYRDITERFLPHVFGAYRVALEEHLPFSLINDWDLTPDTLRKYRVVVLPNAAALSDQQLEALRIYVREGGGLIATTETSLCDELGRPRADFGLADLLGVSYRGRPESTVSKTPIDVNFAVALDEKYWQQRVGSGLLKWGQLPLWDDAALRELVPHGQARFKGPQVRVTAPQDPAELVAELLPDGPQGFPSAENSLPGIIARTVGKGRVVYSAAGIDAALFSYAYPYQRRLLSRLIEWAAGGPPEIQVTAPKCVQVTIQDRTPPDGQRQLLLHFFNNVNTSADLGTPGTDVPLREESLPISGMRVALRGPVPKSWHVEPGGVEVSAEVRGETTVIDLPTLDLHYMLVGEWEG